MNLKDRKLKTDSEKCEAFNQFFCSVFTSSHQVDIFLYPIEKYNWFRLGQENVQEIMQTLDIYKAVGPDGLGNLFFKSPSDPLSKSLTFIFQVFLNKGIFPTDWKISDATPIFKDGDKSDIERSSDQPSVLHFKQFRK